VPDSLWTALALLLILEGLLPFVAPRIWREGFVCIGWIVISPVRLRNWK